MRSSPHEGESASTSGTLCLWWGEKNVFDEGQVFSEVSGGEEAINFFFESFNSRVARHLIGMEEVDGSKDERTVWKDMSS